MKQKLLLISYNFYPNNIAGALRFSNLSQYLEKEDFDISVLTIKEKYFKNKDQELDHGGKIYRTTVFPTLPITYKNSLIRKYRRLLFKFLPLDSSIGWVPFGLVRGLKILKEKNIDKIVVTGPPFSSFLIGYFLSLVSKTDLIIDYRDPWFLWDNYSSFFRSRFSFKKLSFYIESKILKKSKKVIFNTNKTKEAYIKQIPWISNKSEVITNAYKNTDSIKAKLLSDEKITILYAGIFYGERRLNYLYNPLNRIINEKIIDMNKIEIHVFGKVPQEDWDLLEKYSLQKIVVEHNRVGHNEILAYMKGTNILYLAQGFDHRHCIPYKLIDYFSVTKPILALTSLNSATHEVMNKVDCGEVADISSEDSIYNALKIMLKDEKEYSFNGVEKFTWENITQEYIKTLNYQIN